MSEEQTKQAVAEKPDAEATPSAEESSAPDEPGLDELLTQFNEATASQPDSTPEPAKTETTPEIDSVANEVRQLREEQRAQQFQADLDNAIKQVRGDLDPDFFDDAFVESYMDAEAKRNPKFAQAWANRNTNKRGFESVLGAVHRKMAKHATSRPDPNATEDRAAVTAAVTGATDKAPESPAPDLSGMSDAELREFTKKNYGFTPQV